MSSSKSRRDDPLVLVAVAVAVLSLLAWHALSGLDASSLPLAAARLAPFALGFAVLVGALRALRALATRRALRSRAALAVVPADELDPSLDAVLRFASQLTRVRRSVRGWLDKPASAVRVRLQPGLEGRLVYVLEVPGRAEPLLRSALRAYEGVELRDAPALPVAGPGRAMVRAELVLARPSVEPLARLDLDPDPLQAIASALKRGDRSEDTVVALDLLPASGRERRRLQRRLLQQARRQATQTQPRSGLLSGGRSTRADPAELAERRADSRALDAKLKDSGPLFHLQLLVRCHGHDPAQARAAMQRLLGALEQHAERNWLRVAGLPFPGLGFLGSDLPLRRRRFDRRLRAGLFRPARASVVTAREMAGFLKPPTVHCKADNVLRSGTLLPAAPDLPAFTGQPELVPLGRIATEGGERLAGVRLADTFFSYCAGRSRYGKTELAVAQFLHLVRSGHGGLFRDPHEDALARIKAHLTDPGLRERVIEIDLAGRRAAERQPGWNLFELAGQDSEGRVEAVADAFASALRWDERNTRALNLTTQAAQALAAIGTALPAELAPTVFQLPTLLSDEQWRKACLPYLPTASQRFWLDRFPRLAEEAITPVTNLVDRLRASTAITALLGQSQSTYRIREAMDRGLIVLACPGSGGTRDRLIANLLVFDLLHAAKGRATLDATRRRPFFVFLDEVQTYDGASSGNLAALLEQTAKYGVRAFLLNQNPERLTPATLNAVTTNRSHLLGTALNARAAALIAKEWAGQPDPAAITRLPRYRFLAQVTHHGEATKPFLLHGVRAEELIGEGSSDLTELDRTIDRTAGRRPAAEALAHLETLDERILEALRRDRRAEAGAAGERPDRRPGERPQRRSGLRVTTRSEKEKR